MVERRPPGDAAVHMQASPGRWHGLCHTLKRGQPLLLRASPQRGCLLHQLSRALRHRLLLHSGADMDVFVKHVQAEQQRVVCQRWTEVHVIRPLPWHNGGGISTQCSCDVETDSIHRGCHTRLAGTQVLHDARDGLHTRVGGQSPRLHCRVSVHTPPGLNQLCLRSLPARCGLQPPAERRRVRDQPPRRSVTPPTSSSPAPGRS